MSLPDWFCLWIGRLICIAGAIAATLWCFDEAVHRILRSLDLAGLFWKFACKTISERREEREDELISANGSTDPTPEREPKP